MWSHWCRVGNWESELRETLGGSGTHIKRTKECVWEVCEWEYWILLFIAGFGVHDVLLCLSHKRDAMFRLLTVPRQAVSRRIECQIARSVLCAGVRDNKNPTLKFCNSYIRTPFSITLIYSCRSRRSLQLSIWLFWLVLNSFSTTFYYRYDFINIITFSRGFHFRHSSSHNSYLE